MFLPAPNHFSSYCLWIHDLVTVAVPHFSVLPGLCVELKHTASSTLFKPFNVVE